MTDTRRKSIMCLGEENSIASHFTPDSAVGVMDQRHSHSSVRYSALMHFEAQRLQTPVLINVPV